MLNRQNFFLYIYKKAKKNLGGHEILSKFPFLRPLNNFIISQAKTKFAIIEGHKMFLDQHDTLKLSTNGIFEPFETNLVKKAVRKGSVVLDIGANIGYYTLIFAKLVGEQGKVFAFEPEPFNFKLLKKNVEINNYQNVILQNSAVSNNNGKTKLYLSQEQSGTHRIFPSHICSNNYVEVEMVRLDDYFKKNVLAEKISFIKIDVEGAELGVLKGMKSLLELNKKLEILIEFIPPYIKEFGANPIDVLSLLENYNFKIHLINYKTQKIEEVRDKNILLKKYDSLRKEERPVVTNLLCTRN